MKTSRQGAKIPVTKIAIIIRTASLQNRSVDLDTRPYLSIQLANLTWNTTPTDTFIGPDVVYKNVGKVPATNITTAFYIATDKDGGNRGVLLQRRRFLRRG